MFKPNGTKSAKVQRVMLSPKKVAKHQATVHEVLYFLLLVTFGTCLSLFQVAELLADKIEQNRCFSILRSDLIYICIADIVKTTQPLVVYLFRAGVLFSIENAKFWPNLIFSRIHALFGVFFINLNNMVVYQNGEI